MPDQHITSRMRSDIPDPVDRHGQGAALPLSVFIITRNEQARLPATLEALKPWAGEILVVDSGSTDGTVEIAKDHGASVFHRGWQGYGPQKRYAEEQCRFDWILNVDADEVVTPELAEEIRALFADGPPDAGTYRIRILNVYAGLSRPRPLANDYNVVRLYHRSVASYRDHPVFDRVDVRTGKPRQLHAPIYHFPHISITHAVKKSLSFSAFRAGTSKVRSKNGLKVRLFFEFPLSFLKSYIGRRHITGGWRGFYFAMCQAFMRTTRIAHMLDDNEREHQSN